MMESMMSTYDDEDNEYDSLYKKVTRTYDTIGFRFECFYLSDGSLK